MPHYAHIYISPHLDDVICSCGGLIQEQSKRGERVLVVTLFTAGIEDQEELPPYLRALHRLWGFHNADPFALRRAEDLAALELVGADHLHAGWSGALYRRSHDGRFLYTGLGYFGRPAAEDLHLLAQMRRLLFRLRRENPDAIFYAPLGVGGHVDHRLVFQAARYVPGPLRFYEDIPYVFLGKVSPLVLQVLGIAARLGLRANTVSSLGQTGTSLVSALQSRTSLLSGPQLTLLTNRPPRQNYWRDIVHPIDLQAKFEAMLQYTSQIPMLFGSTQWAWKSLETYALSIQRGGRRPLERQWALQPVLLSHRR